jgi:hypothetical protein
VNWIGPLFRRIAKRNLLSGATMRPLRTYLTRTMSTSSELKRAGEHRAVDKEVFVMPSCDGHEIAKITSFLTL